jgi:hypothetical protein
MRKCHQAETDKRSLGQVNGRAIRIVWLI